MGRFKVHIRYNKQDFAKGIELDDKLGHLEGTFFLSTDNKETLENVSEMLFVVASNLRQFVKEGGMD